MVGARLIFQSFLPTTTKKYFRDSRWLILTAVVGGNWFHHSVAVLFTVSWLPIGLLILVMDLLYPPSLENNVSPEKLYLAFAICHIIAMTSAISNPVVYGWLNSNIRRELIQLLPCKCSRPSGVETTAAPSPTMVLCQNGQRPTHHQPATTYTAL